MSNERFLDLQSRSLGLVSPEFIAHGTRIPLDFMKKFTSGGFLMEFGSGNDPELAQLARYYGVVGMEINPLARQILRQQGVVVFPADVRRLFYDHLSMEVIPFLENIDAVRMKGLLANTISNRDIRRIIRVADIYLVPNGHLFIADTLHATEDNPVFRAKNGEKSFTIYQKKWEQRYEVNMQAGLPPGVFAVAKYDGQNTKGKRELDWSDSTEAITNLINSEDFERFARHIKLGGLLAYLKRLGFRPLELIYDTWTSRSGEILSGFYLVARKMTYKFKYHPIYKGYTQRQIPEVRLNRASNIHQDLNQAMSSYGKALKRNIPEIMHENFLSDL